VLEKFLVTRFIGPFSCENLSGQGIFSRLSPALEDRSKGLDFPGTPCPFPE
jgi:hypothetical protein